MAEDVMTAERLSDEQIEQLILEAETRALVKHRPATAPIPDDELTLQEEVPTLSKHKSLPKLKHGLERSTYIQHKQGVAQVKRDLLTSSEQKAGNGLRHLPVSIQTKKQNERPHAGSQWFNLPRTVLTPTLKRDLQLISMRSVLDPHRHYKKTSKSNVPQYSQTGTVIEGPTEFFSARINRKDRSKNFAEEAIATERNSGKFKRKYDDIQQNKTSGKKTHYKALMKKRKGK